MDKCTEVKLLADLSEKIPEIADKVTITNATDNDLVMAYNQGVEMMRDHVMRYLNNQAITIGFGGGVQ